LPFGESEAADEGRIHITKVRLAHGRAPQVEGDVAFDGFAVSGGIDITEDGIVGTLCAKLVPAWYREFLGMDTHNLSRDYIRNAPMLLAVCEADSKTMTAHGTPWRIGVSFVNPDKTDFQGGDLLSYGIWGNYPIAGWFEQNGAGYGHLTYARKKQAWTAWYGATIGTHTGYEQHTYFRNATKESPRYPVLGNIPETVVEHRVESQGRWTDSGQGDHQAGSAARYHPLVGDIFMQKHKHDELLMFQYGFEDVPSGNPLKGGMGNANEGLRLGWPPGNESDWGRQEGSMRPCGEGIITAFVADGGHTCAVISKDGNIMKWVTIEKSTAFGSMGNGPGKGEKPWIDSEYLRMTRLATLGSPEVAAQCGSDARFLMGYETASIFDMRNWPSLGRKRFLVELDGECNRMTEPLEVTEHNLWPMNQEWTTTKEGAVVWVTAWKWEKKLWNGGYAPLLSSVHMTYNARAIRGEGLKVPHQWGHLNSSQSYWGSPGENLVFEASTNATNWAVLSVYYPSGKMPTREALAVPVSRPIGEFRAFGWRLLMSPTRGGGDVWDLQNIIFKTASGKLWPSEHCKAVAGNSYAGNHLGLGPHSALKDDKGWVHGPQGSYYDPNGRWVGVPDGNIEIWAGLQCTVEQAALQSVSIQEPKHQCSWQPKHARTVFLSAWTGQEWLEVAELSLRCDQCHCGDVYVIWNSTQPFKVPTSF